VGWLLVVLLLLILLLIILAVAVFRTTEDDVGLVAVIPAGGSRDRAEILDKEGYQKGYGIRRSDGSWGFFRTDGSTLDVISGPKVVEKTADGQLTRIILEPRREKYISPSWDQEQATSLSFHNASNASQFDCPPANPQRSSLAQQKGSGRLDLAARLLSYLRAAHHHCRRAPRAIPWPLHFCFIPQTVSF
jgi:hypothetical protein